MRDYLWRRRQAAPDRELWSRAKKRAADRGIPFELPIGEIIIPPTCPVLGIPLHCEGQRSPNSPSLDRIDPRRGYISANVRVVSDKANRLKGDRDLPRLKALAALSTGPASSEFRKIALYVEREALLQEVRKRASSGKPGAGEWHKIATFLDQVFSRGQLIEIELDDAN